MADTAGKSSKQQGEYKMPLPAQRWWVLTIERALLEVSVSSARDQGRAATAILQTAVNELYKLAGKPRRKTTMSFDPGTQCELSSECDPGFECIDGECVPINAAAAYHDIVE